MRRELEVPVSINIDKEDIARRAFEIYEARGCEQGHDVEDWLEAERELAEERGLTGVLRAASGRS